MERALGWPRDTFIKAYEANRSAANSSAIEASPVALAVQALVAEEAVFEGTATELLSKLSRFADEQAKKHRGWPDTGWKLSGALRRLAPSLRASGVEVTIGERKPDRNRTRVIGIGRAASAVSGVSAIAENQPSLRTHSDASTCPSDGAPQPDPRSSVPKACVAHAPDTADAPAQTSMVRGEI